MSVQGKECALADRGRNCGLDFCQSVVCQQYFLCCRYTVVNEINKVDLGEASVFVYFIMKLSRVEGGTSYVGFHGGGFCCMWLLTLSWFQTNVPEQDFSNSPLFNA